MSPEVFECIRRDFKQSLPSIIAGDDTAEYPDGWALALAAPKNMGTTARYVASQLGFRLEEITGVRGDKWICRARMMIYLIIRERFPKCSLGQIADRLHKDRQTVSSGLVSARQMLENDPEFRRLYERLHMELVA